MQKKIYLFLSSPGDCRQEREAVRAIVGRLNSDPLLSSQFMIGIEASDTDSGVPMPSSLPPQDGINRAIKPPEECDIFVCIIRSRFGTPPSKMKDDGSPFLSGTEYEFHRARTQAKITVAFQPFMLTYRGPQDETANTDSVDQIKLVEGFFKGPCFFDKQGRATGAFHCYASVEDFECQLEGHLKHHLSMRIPWLSQSFTSWLQVQRDKLVKDAGPRYTRNAHVETGIMASFDWLLHTPVAFKKLDEALKDVYDKFPHREPSTVELKKVYQDLAKKFRGTEFWRDPLDFSAIIALTEQTLAAYRPLEEEVEKELYALPLADRNKHTERERGTRDRLHSLSSVVEKAQQCQNLLEDFTEFASKRIILVVGPAGQGKTHTLVEQVSRCVDDGHVAIGVLGHKLMHGSELWPEIFSNLGLPSSITAHEFLVMIDRQARERRSVALLAFDALNETSPRSRWQNQLLGMLEEIKQFPNIAVVLAVREDYLPYTLPRLLDNGDSPWVLVHHRGFAGVEAEAMFRYFAAYGLEPPIFPPIIPEFTNPLYLKILCQSLQLQHSHEIPSLLPSWLDVHTRWLESLEIKAKATPELSLDLLKKRIIHKTLGKIADTMLANSATSLLREAAEHIAQDISGTSRLISFLISEQVLFETIQGNPDEELVQLGYERFSDTFLAERLLAWSGNGENGKLDVDSIKHAFALGGELYRYIRRNDSSYQNQVGILRSLMLLVPKLTGSELPELLPQGEYISDYLINNAFRDSLLWRSRREEFGGNRASLWKLLTKDEGGFPKLEYLIQLALIPGHPFHISATLHQWLKRFKSPGSRDAAWTVELSRLWEDENSIIGITVSWAATQKLNGIHRETAETIALLLAWCCTSSNNGLKETATRGLCRLFKARPEIVRPMLTEFEAVNDAYVVESLLLAVLGVVLDSLDADWIKAIAEFVYVQQFPKGNPRWCHLFIRHYARRIVEEGVEAGLVVDEAVIKPPYSSRLPLERIPKRLKKIKRKYDSSGFFRLVGSATQGDFFRYILDANSGRFPFKATPLGRSTEPVRSYRKVEWFYTGAAPKEDVFDIALSARYIVYNCLKLGWTAERFDQFDTGYQITRDRITRGTRTERIGKKYQWIGWRTLQAFLSDHYPLNLRLGTLNGDFDNPTQLDEEMSDPLRWLVEAPKSVAQLIGQEIPEEDDTGAIPSTTPWPEPSVESVIEWIMLPSKGPLISTCVLSVPKTVTKLQPGKWLRADFEFTLEPGWRPGYWTLPEVNVSIWLLVRMRIVRSADIAKLRVALSEKHVQEALNGIGRNEYPGVRNATLDQWLNLENSLEPGFLNLTEIEYAHDDYWPVPYAHPFATLGSTDFGRAERQITLPSPWLIRQWDLKLDKETGCYRRPDGRIVFHNEGIVGGKNVIFICVDAIKDVLEIFGWSIFWFIRGEEFAGFMPHYDFAKRVDVHGVAYLDKAGYPEVLLMNRELE